MPLLRMPPPSPDRAELRETVLFVSVQPALGVEIPPPSDAAELPETVLR